MNQDTSLLREIGAGAYGTVHLAREDGKLVAVKSCRRPADPAGAESFERERRGVRERLRLPPHDGLVRVLRLVEDPAGSWFRYSMELADSEDGSSGVEDYRPKTLASVLDAEIALPLRDCIDLGLRLAGALQFLQSHHLVHRDVKPSNVLWVRGRPVLADVGLLRDVREAASLVGTPGYAPPEPPGTPEGDVYGLGRTLWRAATGRAPDEAALVPCAEADVDAPFYWRFLAVLQRACAADPARRYRSAKALRRDLLRLRAAVRLASVPLWLRAAAAGSVLLAAGYGIAGGLHPSLTDRLATETDARERAEWREKYLQRQLEESERRRREYGAELSSLRAERESAGREGGGPEPSGSAEDPPPPRIGNGPVPSEAEMIERLEDNFRAVSNFMERMRQPVRSARDPQGPDVPRSGGK